MPSMKFDIRSLSLIAAVATAYFLAGELAIALSPEVSGGVPRLIMWPAGGIALAAIWRFGLPALIGSAIGAWLGGLLISGNIWLAALGAAATLTPIYAVVRWLKNQGISDLFDSPRNVARFTFYCGTFATGASSGAWLLAATALTSTTTPTVWLNVWLNWFAASMLGVFLTAPPLLAIRDWLALTRRQWLELAIIFSSMAITCWYLFGVLHERFDTQLAMMSMPLLLMMALRFNFGVVATMTLCQALIAALVAKLNLVAGDLDHSIHTTYRLVQLFCVALGLSNLAIGAGLAAIRGTFDLLRRSEMQFRAMFEQAGVGLMLTDIANGERLVNQKLCDMLGYRAEELPIPSLSAVSHPEDAAVTDQLADRLLSGEIGIAHQEKRYFHKDQSTVWASVTMSILRTDDKAQQFFVGVFKDITESKRIEAQLRGQSNILRELMAGAPLQTLLEQIALLTEELWPRSRAVICTADYDKQVLHFGAAPSLTEAQIDRTYLIPIVDSVGVIATAAARRQITICTDTSTDPLWKTLRAYTRARPWLRAAWSVPCNSNEELPVGVVSLYFDHPRAPTEQDIDLLETVGSLTAIVIQRHRDARELFTSEQRLRLMFDQAAIGVVLAAADGSSLQINQKYLDIVGYSYEELRDSQFRIVMPPEDQDRIERDGQRLAAGEINQYQAERRYIRKDGCEIWCNVTTSAVYDETGAIGFYIGLLEDITERKVADAEIERLALFDVLTGLPNRRLFGDRLQTALATARRSSQMGALIYIDLDNFKQLNDSRGHAAGDDLLQQIAVRLKQQLREEDTVARLGGDEFVVLMQNIGDDLDYCTRAVTHIAQKICARLAEPYRLQSGFEHLTTASIGITLFPKGDEVADDLMKQADIAMYRVKAEQRNSFRFYAPEMHAAAEQRIALERDFRETLQRDGFEVFLQPQYDAERHIIGSEALLRWRRANNQFVSPLEFIPLAEQTGLIVPLGEWVLREVAQIIRQCELHGYDLTISVNVSPRQFQEPNFVERVRDILWEAGADAGRLIVEITEGIVMSDFDDARKKMFALKKLGVRLSIDDFGTGHSSLAYLKRLPLHELKIDREFIKDLPHDANDVALVEAILAVTRHLQLEVVAEGVETIEQFAFLAQRQCQRFQGFYLARPQPVADYFTLIAEHCADESDSSDDLQKIAD